MPLVISETGCTAALGRSMQVPQAAVRFDRYAAGAMEPTVTPLPPTEMPTTALAPGGIMGAIARRIPVGVVGCITPYNFPIVNMAGKLGPALAMGNTVIVRPASQDPLAVIDLCRILNDCRLPARRHQLRHRIDAGHRRGARRHARRRHDLVHRLDRRRA